MRTVFFGTPAIAVPALQALVETTTVVGVVCQPDRPAGRGLKLSSCAVKTAAAALGLEVHQPVKVKTGSLDTWLRERGTEVAVVLAYGRILPPAVLAAPTHGCMNLHASLLPRYRGAAPINWAIAEGETETGISLMQMDEGLDTGPVYVRRSLPIGPRQTAGDVTEALAELAAEVVRSDLRHAVDGDLVPESQDDSQATLAPPLRSEHLEIDWQWSAERIVNRVRALAPRPGARTRHGKLGLKLLDTRRGPELAHERPGTVAVDSDRQVLVHAADRTVQILIGQLEGRRALSASDLLNGRALRAGDRLG